MAEFYCGQEMKLPDHNLRVDIIVQFKVSSVNVRLLVTLASIERVNKVVI